MNKVILMGRLTRAVSYTHLDVYKRQDAEGQKETFCGFKVEQVVDTVGAGDGFAVGIISGYLEGLSIEKMIERANAIGAIQVSVESDNEGLPTQEELQAYRCV